MENFLEGGISQLEEARNVITNLSKKEQEVKDSERAFKAKQKELELQQKRVADKISSSIKKERSELEKEHEAVLNEASKTVKEAEHQKKNAKSAAVNLRIQEETYDYVAENKRLSAENVDIIKKGKLPSFCKSQMYYSLFAPSTTRDYLFCGLGIVILAGIIPFIVSLFVDSTLIKVLVWILIIVLFAAIYFLVHIWTRKGLKNEFIQQMRPNIEKMTENKSAIKKYNKEIKSDPDESRYNLGAFDEKLERAKADYNDKANNRDEALKYFDEIRSADIKNNIEQESETILAELSSEVEKSQAESQAKTSEYDEALSVFNQYVPEIGEKNMTVDKINELIELINEGKAANVKEALEVQQNKGKQQ